MQIKAKYEFGQENKHFGGLVKKFNDKLIEIKKKLA